MTNELFYEGTEPFLAVVCTEADRPRVLGWLEQLSAEGYRIWSGTESDGESIGEQTALRLEKAEALFLILTPRTVWSRPFRSTLDFALLRGKKICAYLEGSPDMLTLSMRTELGVLACSVLGQPGDPASALEEIRRIPEMERCFTPVPAEPEEQEPEPPPIAEPEEKESEPPPIIGPEEDGTGEETVCGVPEEALLEEETTEQVKDQLSPMLLFRLKDGTCRYLCAEKVRLGRSGSRSDLAFADNSKISSHHADLTQKDGEIYLTDAGSSNGTYLNGVRLQPDVPVKLPDHALFQLCDDVFQLVYGPDAQRLKTDGTVLLLRNAATSEKRYVTEEELRLDRKHPWAGGTLNDMLVSREHAIIIHVNGQPCLVDTGSYNGTFLDGKQLTAGQPEPLRDGMTISLGGTELVCSLIPIDSGDGGQNGPAEQAEQNGQDGRDAG